MGASENLLDEHVADSLHNALARQHIVIPPIQVQRVTTLMKSVSGKTPMIISHIPQDDLA
jgi:hypothetical protein